jgi:hypothetical protein
MAIECQCRNHRESLSKRQAQRQRAAAAIVMTIYKGSFATTRQMCTTTSRPNTTPVVMTYRFIEYPPVGTFSSPPFNIIKLIGLLLRQDLACCRKNQGGEKRSRAVCELGSNGLSKLAVPFSHEGLVMPRRNQTPQVRYESSARSPIDQVRTLPLNLKGPHARRPRWLP